MAALIHFAKADACGNDFLIVETTAAAGQDLATLAVALCERNTGVGADGVEFFDWTGEASGRIRLHNADGSIAEISGNGTRCVAAWMAQQRSAKPGDVLAIETDAGLRTCRIASMEGPRYQIVSAMGVPTHEPAQVVLRDGTVVEGIQISTGNPHFVVFVETEDFTCYGRSWQQVGDEICHHADFPEGTNVEFVRILGSSEIAIRIFERGVGPTLSSGTGTCATATASIGYRGAKSPLKVNSPGGPQKIEWGGPGTELQLTGPAKIIARGEALL